MTDLSGRILPHLPATRRFFKRAEVTVPVMVRLEGGEWKESVGMLTDLSAGGARLQTKAPLSEGSSLRLSTLPGAAAGFTELEAVVVRQHPDQEDRRVCGVRFQDSAYAADSIRMILERQSDLAMQRKMSSIKLMLLLMGCVIFPLVCALGIARRGAAYGIPFFALIAVICLERFWEIFFTSREKRTTHSWGDWTLSMVTFYYAVAVLLLTAEFFFVKSWVTPSWAMGFGILFLAVSFFIRGWGMKTLGSQWSVRISLNPERSRRERVLVTAGPYRYVRHPIYTAYFLELFGLTLTAGCYGTLLFCLCVNIPVQIIRTRYEEQEILHALGQRYAAYMAAVPAFLPRFSKPSDDRRKTRHFVDFPERRRR